MVGRARSADKHGQLLYYVPSLHPAEVREGWGVAQEGRDEQVTEWKLRVEAFHLVIGAQTPDWLVEAMVDGRITAASKSPALNTWGNEGIDVHGPYGPRRAMPGDWIIRDGDGRLHMVKNADFELSYDLPYGGKRADLIVLDDLEHNP